MKSNAIRLLLLSVASSLLFVGTSFATDDLNTAKYGDVKQSDETLSSWLPGQLGKVLAISDKEIAKEGQKIEEAKKQADDYNYGRHLKGTPEFEYWMTEIKAIKTVCPEGVAMPIAQAEACNIRIAKVNVYNDKIEKQVKEKLAERDRITYESNLKIQELKQKRTKILGMIDRITACNNIATQKACLDKFFDNQTSTGDIVVVPLPDSFGGKKLTVGEVIERYKKSGDLTPSQLMTLYRSIDTIKVPSPN